MSLGGLPVLVSIIASALILARILVALDRCLTRGLQLHHCTRSRRAHLAHTPPRGALAAYPRLLSCAQRSGRRITLTHKET